MTDTAVSGRKHTGTNATRLLSAGAYLEPGYRSTVISELVKNQYRVVPPAYGYDAVTVLAHALAARRLRRIQVTVSIVGTVLIYSLADRGLINPLLGFFLILWLLWAVAFLRRVATMEALVSRLKPTADGSMGPDRRYPKNNALTLPLVQKITVQQADGAGAVYFGGFTPFVGAGEQVREWTATELLLQAPPPKVMGDFAAGVGGGPVDESGLAESLTNSRPIKHFTVPEITDYVEKRLIAELRDDVEWGGRIPELIVERRPYGKATVLIRAAERRAAAAKQSAPRGEEDYEALRDYLCIRIGSWDQELVTSMFVRFDIKGNTLHSEFSTYALAPIIESFHLVDRLPDRLSGRMLRRLARDVVLGKPRGFARWILKHFKKGSRRKQPWNRRMHALAAADTSQFRLGRYAVRAYDPGAIESIREMGANPDFLHFFQKSDSIKYTKVVERLLLQIIRTFLQEHNVDLGDHDARQTNILNNHNFGIQSGGGDVTMGDGNVMGANNTVTNEAKGS